MQVSYFHNGGYVVHKITGSFEGRVSAWFDAGGNMLDAEQLIGWGPDASREVKRDGPIWRHAQYMGRVYANRAVSNVCPA